MELLLELGGSSLGCCNLVLERRKPRPLGIQLLPLGGQALLALPNRTFRPGDSGAALLEPRLLVSDLVLHTDLPFVGFHLFGEGQPQLALALLGVLELSAKVFDDFAGRFGDRLGLFR